MELACKNYELLDVSQDFVFGKSVKQNVLMIVEVQV
jgi:hypothetical protein